MTHELEEAVSNLSISPPARNAAWSFTRTRWAKVSFWRKLLFVFSLATLLSVIGFGNLLTYFYSQRALTSFGEMEARFIQELLRKDVIGLENAKTDLTRDQTYALDEVSQHHASKLRVLRIWRLDGRLAYSTQPGEKQSNVGQQIPTAALLNDVHVISAAALAVESQESGLLVIYTKLPTSQGDSSAAVAEVRLEIRNIAEILRHARLTLLTALALATFSTAALLYLLIVDARAVIRRYHRALAALMRRNRQLGARSERLRRVAAREHVRAAAAGDLAHSEFGVNLHDGPVQVLTLAILRLSSLPPSHNTSENETRLEVQGLLQQTLVEIRNASSRVILPDVDTMNLNEVVENAAARHRMYTGTEVERHLPDPPLDASKSIKLAAYRVVCEGLNNAFKHAGGEGQAVELRLCDGNVEIVVRDRGGEPPVIASQGAGGVGIRALRARIAAMGGRLHLTRQECGSRLRAIIPLSYGLQRGQ